MTKLTKAQKITRAKTFKEAGRYYTIFADIRHDDQCGNGHNTFSITGEIWRSTEDGAKRDNDCETGGCIHDEIEKHFPDLAQYVKWHLVSTDGPVHYIANTIYHVQTGRLDYARSTAVWSDATDADLLAEGLRGRLEARLPALMVEFRAAVESLGFTY